MIDCGLFWIIYWASYQSFTSYNQHHVIGHKPSLPRVNDLALGGCAALPHSFTFPKKKNHLLKLRRWGRSGIISSPFSAASPETSRSQPIRRHIQVAKATTKQTSPIKPLTLLQVWTFRNLFSFFQTWLKIKTSDHVGHCKQLSDVALLCTFTIIIVLYHISGQKSKNCIVQGNLLPFCARDNKHVESLNLFFEPQNPQYASWEEESSHIYFLISKVRWSSGELITQLLVQVNF